MNKNQYYLFLAKGMSNTEKHPFNVYLEAVAESETEAQALVMDAFSDTFPDMGELECVGFFESKQMLHEVFPGKCIYSVPHHEPVEEQTEKKFLCRITAELTAPVDFNAEKIGIHSNVTGAFNCTLEDAISLLYIAALKTIKAFSPEHSEDAKRTLVHLLLSD